MPVVKGEGKGEGKDGDSPSKTDSPSLKTSHHFSTIELPHSDASYRRYWFNGVGTVVGVWCVFEIQPDAASFHKAVDAIIVGACGDKPVVDGEPLVPTFFFTTVEEEDRTVMHIGNASQIKEGKGVGITSVEPSRSDPTYDYQLGFVRFTEEGTRIRDFYINACIWALSWKVAPYMYSLQKLPMGGHQTHPRTEPVKRLKLSERVKAKQAGRQAERQAGRTALNQMRETL